MVSSGSCQHGVFKLTPAWCLQAHTSMCPYHVQMVTFLTFFHFFLKVLKLMLQNFKKIWIDSLLACYQLILHLTVQLCSCTTTAWCQCYNNSFTINIYLLLEILKQMFQDFKNVGDKCLVSLFSFCVSLIYGNSSCADDNAKLFEFQHEHIKLIRDDSL